MTRKLGKMTALVGAFALTMGMGACSSERSSDAGNDSTSGDAAATGSCEFEAAGTIGVAMPTKSLERWNRDGAHLKENLEDMGFTVDLQYADNKVDQQIS